MSRYIFIILLPILFLSACAPNQAVPTSAPQMELADCALTASGGMQVDARCGSFDVPEDRANPQGRQISLHFAIIPAIKRNPSADPLFMLAGGPGQSAMETFPQLYSAFFSIHENRDIVLVDQRGTGKSNPLRCLDPEDEGITDEQALAALKACPATLDADVRFYTTEIAMTDLDTIRDLLGYEKINLYGASYGTRAALTYLRMYPERVRTVTLDAVVDPDFVLLLDAAQDGQKALDGFFSRCEASEACNGTFSGLENELDTVIERLDATPEKITIPHPLTNEPTEITVTRDFFVTMLFNTLYVPDLVATLPLSIHAAYEKNDYVPLISQAYMVNAGLYDGMFYAVACTEDAPLIEPAQAIELSQGSVFGDRTADFVDVCTQWPRGSVSDAFRTPLVSDVPVMLLSGELDPITPPWHAEKAAEGLSNHLHLVFTGMGHGNFGNRCTAGIVENFLDNGSLANLDTSCVKDIQPPPFFVNFNGPQP